MKWIENNLDLDQLEHLDHNQQNILIWKMKLKGLDKKIIKEIL